MNFDILQHNKTVESISTRPRDCLFSHQQEVHYTAYSSPNLFIVSILQNRPEPSAAVRQLFASFPAVSAQRVQDGGLCCWKNQLLCGAGGPVLWPEAFPL